MQPVAYNFTITRGIVFKGADLFFLDANDQPIDLTGYVPFAEVREEPESDVILDLNPSIVDAAGGKVTIPALQDEETILLVDVKAKWDFIFQFPSGERLGPYVSGSFTIKSIITEPPE